MSGTFLEPGDVVTTEIEGLGQMRNRCVARPERS
jgi:2-keto-4-pentenoate hydratase/2-oxohepta-3-ene-1,7-dioic acid hydratase in catechol pathway